MEEIIASVIEKSLVGGAFLLLLYHYVTRVTTTLEKISKTMDKIDMRFEQVEQRITRLEEKGRL